MNKIDSEDKKYIDDGVLGCSSTLEENYHKILGKITEEDILSAVNTIEEERSFIIIDSEAINRDAPVILLAPSGVVLNATQFGLHGHLAEEIYEKLAWKYDLNDDELTRFIDESLDDLGYRLGFITLNTGKTYKEDRCKIVIEKNITPQQDYLLRDWLNRRVKDNPIIHLFCMDSFNKYDLREYDDTQLIKIIRKCCVTGVLYEDKKSSTIVDSQGNPLTKEQVRFFKNSSVVDNNGNLLVCYHGTKEEFEDNEFRNSINWFSTKEEYSKEFSTFRSETGGYIYKAYLNCKNTFDCGVTDGRAFGVLPTKPYKFSPNMQNIISALGLSEEEARQLIKDVVDERELEGYIDGDKNSYEYGLKVHVITRTKAFANLVKSKGYDSIKATEGGVVCFGVFNARDIKLISNKNPTSSNKFDEDINAKLNDTLTPFGAFHILNKYKE